MYTHTEYTQYDVLYVRDVHVIYIFGTTCFYMRQRYYTVVAFTRFDKERIAGEYTDTSPTCVYYSLFLLRLKKMHCVQLFHYAQPECPLFKEE